MEKYVYLLLGLALLTVVGILLLLRKDLARLCIQFGAVGGIAGLVAELFYFRDYWQPPTLMGVAKISVEDFLFGFAIMAVSIAMYPVLSNAHFIKDEARPRRYVYGLFFALGCMAMIVFNLLLGINSIFVSSVIFIIFSAIMLSMRRDLIKVAAVSAVAVTLLIIPMYVILFNILAPEFWSKYWLLADAMWGATILGNIPLTELIWYFSWSLFAGISYPFASGSKLRRRDIEIF